MRLKSKQILSVALPYKCLILRICGRLWTRHFYCTHRPIGPKRRSLALRVSAEGIRQLIVIIEQGKPYRRNRNRNLKMSKALLKNQAHQRTSLFTRAATNQRESREAQIRFPEYQEGTE